MNWTEAATPAPENRTLLLNVRLNGVLGTCFCIGFYEDGKYFDQDMGLVDVTHWIVPEQPVFKKIGPKKQECTLEASAQGSGSALC